MSRGRLQKHQMGHEGFVLIRSRLSEKEAESKDSFARSMKLRGAAEHIGLIRLPTTLLRFPQTSFWTRTTPLHSLEVANMARNTRIVLIVRIVEVIQLLSSAYMCLLALQLITPDRVWPWRYVLLNRHCSYAVGAAKHRQFCLGWSTCSNNRYADAVFLPETPDRTLAVTVDS